MAADAPTTPEMKFGDENACEDRDKLSPLPLQPSTKHNRKQWKRLPKAPRFRTYPDNHHQKLAAGALSTASTPSNTSSSSNSKEEGKRFSIQQVVPMPIAVGKDQQKSVNPNPMPYSNLSLLHLCQLRVRQRNICYVAGLPQTMREEEMKSMQWFGRFGKIKHISVTPHLFDSSNVNGVYIIFLSEVSAANAIEFANSCIFNDGRKLKATFGSQRYCYSFVLRQPCTDRNCQYLHHWVDVKQLLNDHEINTVHAMQFIPSVVVGAQSMLENNIQSQLIQFQQTQINTLCEKVECLQIHLATQSQQVLKWKGLYEMLMMPYNAIDEKFKTLKAEYDELRAKYDAAVTAQVKSETAALKIKQEPK